MRRLAEACVDALTRFADTDARIWLVDGDLAPSYGVDRFAAVRPDRFVMAGIAEQNMVSMAAGMAACGARPWVFSFAAFLAYRAADQIRVSVSQTELPVALVGSHAGGCGGRNGKTHQSLNDLGVIGGFPHIEIWTPGDAAEAAAAVASSLTRDKPTYIRSPRDPLPGLPGAATEGLRLLSEPADDLLIAPGIAAHWASPAVETLRGVGVRIELAHINQVRPVAKDVVARIRAARRWIVLEDHVRLGGVGDMLSHATGRRPDLWIGWPADWTGGSGECAALRTQCGLDTRAIVAKISEELAR